MNRDLEYFLQAFSKMKRAYVGGYYAPHKPILLLAIIDLVEKGDIKSNHIYLTDELISRFKVLWKYLVDDGMTQSSYLVAEGLTVTAQKYPFKINIALPYFHMNNEPFWELIQSDTFIKSQSYSIKKLRECFKYAVLDERLFFLVQSSIDRRVIRNKLQSMI